MADYACGMLMGAARPDLAVVLADLCGFNGYFAGKGTAMPIFTRRTQFLR